MKSITILFPPELQQLFSFHKPANQTHKSGFCLRLPCHYSAAQISAVLELFFSFWKWDNHKHTNIVAPYPPVKPMFTTENMKYKMYLAGALVTSSMFKSSPWMREYKYVYRCQPRHMWVSNSHSCRAAPLPLPIVSLGSVVLLVEQSYSLGTEASGSTSEWAAASQRRVSPWFCI